jgi:hypothetical protein
MRPSKLEFSFPSQNNTTLHEIETITKNDDTPPKE